MKVGIIEACRDDNLLRPFLGEDLITWNRWMTVLRIIYGHAIGPRQHAIIEQCTGRTPALLPSTGFDAALLLTGRRSGKSRIAAIVAAYEGCLAGHEEQLSPGETGVVCCTAPTRYQATIVRNYVRAIFEAPLLEPQVVRENADGFDLRNGISIQILAGDYRTVRGPTLVAAIVDEAAFFGYDHESKVKSDTELIRALRPALATVRGKLIAISSPYARAGWCYATYKGHYGNNGGKTLVWNCPSRTMNPTLPQAVVDDAMAEDLAAAKSEYMGEFRDEVNALLPRTVVESVVVPGRRELLPRMGTHYSAFADLSGGRADDAALAIGHRGDDRKVIVDFLRRYRPPYNPQEVIANMAAALREYGCRWVTGDNYGAEFVAAAFTAQGINYSKCSQPKSALYLELLPRICSGEIELPDDEALINQLASLERRTRSGGKDTVDHPPGQHDDLANVVAGIAVTLGDRRVVGGLPMLGTLMDFYQGGLTR